MKKANGFTLVELLAVIAILAILIIIALPNILKMFNTAKKNSFVSESRSMFKTAEQKFITSNGEFTCYSNDPDDFGEGCAELDTTGRKNFTYSIWFSEDGEMEYFYMQDDNYCVYLDYYYSDDGYVGVEDIVSEIVGEGDICGSCGFGGPC
ncbi:MAG: prepilin-type N-terminal cleavage/methylation domain-containing protein [Tenericutes bacterium]|nr:prepilin-type N-terminal cleavage/methylation domain-containing protein [Mycoplasmatota bacterium]